MWDLLSVCGHILYNECWVLEPESDFSPRVFQDSKEQWEIGKRGEAEETSGQEGSVLGQPSHPLPQSGEVSHSTITHSCHPIVQELTFSYGFCSLTGTLMAPMNKNKIPFPWKPRSNTVYDSEVREWWITANNFHGMVSYVCLTQLSSVSTVELRSWLPVQVMYLETFLSCLESENRQCFPL